MIRLRFSGALPALALVVGLGVTTEAQALSLWLVDGESKFYTVDVDTETVTEVADIPSGDNDRGTYNDIARAPDGRFFGQTETYDGDNTKQFHELDFDTDTKTEINTNYKDFTSLTIGRNNVAYAMGYDDKNLFTIDLGTGDLKNLGDTGYYGDGDLAFHKGDLYLSANKERYGNPVSYLVKLNLDELSNSVEIGSFGNDKKRFWGMDSLGDTLWAASGTSLFEVDTNDASLDREIDLSEKVGNIYGMTSAVAAVPVPAALPLLATVFGALGLAARRRRKVA